MPEVQFIHQTRCMVCGSTNLKTAFKVKDHSISGAFFPLVDCLDCGLRFTQNAPDAASIGPYYQSENYISHSNTKKGMVNQLYHTAREWMLKRKRNLIEKEVKGKKVLDVGSGTGYFLNHLKQHGFETLGVEVDEGARQFARDQFHLDVRPTEDLAEGRIVGTFDAITLWHVLEHLHDPHTYLERIFNLLEAEGVLIIAVPNFSSLDAEHYGAEWAAYDVPRHLWHFKPETLERLLSDKGSQLKKKSRLPLDPFYVDLLSEQYKASGSAGAIKAFWKGGQSYLQSLQKVDRSSSVVYIFGKE